MSDDLRYPQIIRMIAETPWAILPSKLAEITDFIAFKAAGGEVSPEEIRARFGTADDRPRPQAPGKIAVMPVMGTLSHRMNLMSHASGGESYETLGQTFRSLVDDPKIDAIVLDIDSPGGSVSGVDELASEIYATRGVKPVTAVANSLMASAAYWLGSAADEIVVTPSAIVGSIGVIAAHEDRSAMYEKLGVDVSLITAGRYKAENNPFEPMTEEGRAEIQKRVDEAYDRFVNTVARNRGVPGDFVRSGFGEGRVVGAQEAVRLGMADRIDTIDNVISTITTDRDAGNVAARLGAASFGDHIELVAADVELLAQRCRDRVEYRSRDRRGLSSDNRERLDALRATLIGAVANLDTLLVQPDPDVSARNRMAMLRTQRRLRSIDATLLGVAE